MDSLCWLVDLIQEQRVQQVIGVNKIKWLWYIFLTKYI